MLGRKNENRWSAGRWHRNTAFCAALAIAASAGAAKTFTEWTAPVSAESLSGSSPLVNTASNDGCPIQSPYDGSLYMASNRPGGHGGLDIWIAPRSGEGWGAPVNAGPAVNTAADEFCPTPARGNRFFFVRRLSMTDTDIYVVKKLPKGWGTPTRLPTGANAINGPAEEWSPSWFETKDGREILYFSSTRNGHPAQDIFYSVDFGPAQLAAGGVNSSASDARPNVRHDGLDWSAEVSAPISPARAERRRQERPAAQAWLFSAWRAAAHSPLAAGRGLAGLPGARSVRFSPPPRSPTV